MVHGSVASVSRMRVRNSPRVWMGFVGSNHKLRLAVGFHARECTISCRTHFSYEKRAIFQRDARIRVSVTLTREHLPSANCRPPLLKPGLLLLARERASARSVRDSRRTVGRLFSLASSRSWPANGFARLTNAIRQRQAAFATWTPVAGTDAVPPRIGVAGEPSRYVYTRSQIHHVQVAEREGNKQHGFGRSCYT